MVASKQPPRTLGEALSFPGVEDIEFDPPRADRWDHDRQHLLDLAARRMQDGGIITDGEASAFSDVLESRLRGCQRPEGGWYPLDVLRALSGKE